jgi:N-hydroxyarylamine O-acetyltransferase
MTSEKLAAYCARLGLGDLPAPDAEGLTRLQTAHRQAIAFENIDVLLGRGIRVDSTSVFDKLVARRRGGYCFEQNRLYADMLAEIGFRLRPLMARVRLAVPEGVVPPRTHILLLVELDDGYSIADAGFGGSFVPVMPLRDGVEAQTPDGARHRLRRIGSPDGEWVLERGGPRASTDGRARDHEEWQAQYTFDLVHVADADLEQANHWVSTWPQSRFVIEPRVTIVLPAGFRALTGTSLSIADQGAQQKREIADAAEWRAVMADLFGIELTAEEVSALNLFAG